MNSKTISVEEAVSSLQEIRRVIDRVQSPATHSSAFAPRLILQLGAALLSGSFLFAELLDGSITESFLLSRFDKSFRLYGISSMGIGAFVLAAIVFCVLEIGAKANRVRTEEYIAKHFAQLSLLSFSSDLFVKFIALSGVILALRPDWVGPMMLVFTGDYLLQGRLFTFPFRLGLIVGAICIVLGVAQFWVGDPSLLPPLATFSGLSFASAISTLQSMRPRNAQSSSDQAEASLAPNT